MSKEVHKNQQKKPTNKVFQAFMYCFVSSWGRGSQGSKRNPTFCRASISDAREPKPQ